MGFDDGVVQARRSVTRASTLGTLALTNTNSMNVAPVGSTLAPRKSERLAEDRRASYAGLLKRPSKLLHAGTSNTLDSVVLSTKGEVSNTAKYVIVKSHSRQASR